MTELGDEREDYLSAIFAVFVDPGRTADEIRSAVMLIVEKVWEDGWEVGSDDALADAKGSDNT